MIHPEQFTSHTLRNSSSGEQIMRILAAAINAVDPGTALRRFVQRQGDQLVVDREVYDLTTFKRIYVAAIGKAAMAMAVEFLTVLGDRLTGGLIVPKHLSENTIPRFEIIAGGHPIPDANSLSAGEQLIDLVSGLTADDLLICLISGGGSALVSLPAPGVSLEDMQTLTSLLLASGARIDEVNTLRRHLDIVKGGGIAKLAHPARVISLILSDVVGNPLETIASGPTAPDPSTRADALRVIERFNLQPDLPASILEALEKLPETPKPDDALFANVHNLIVGSNLMAAQAALRQAEQEELHPYLLCTDLQGEARQAGVELSQTLRWAWKRNDPVPRPACIVAGGETTVTLHGDGRGGRNQELALAAVGELAGFPQVMLVTLATDGEDGPTDAAGAVVSSDTYYRAQRIGLHPQEYLDRNDAYAFFSELDDLLKPGPTGTNVNDLTFLFTF